VHESEEEDSDQAFGRSALISVEDKCHAVDPTRFKFGVWVPITCQAHYLHVRRILEDKL